jgi:hypothetical protein
LLREREQRGHRHHGTRSREGQALHDAAGDADAREGPRSLAEGEGIHALGIQVGALEDPADHRHEQFGVPVLGQGLLDEQLAVSQEGDGAQLGGGLDGEEIHATIISRTPIAGLFIVYNQYILY